MRQYLENGLSCYETICGDFPQVSGIWYSFEPARAAGSRLVNLTLPDGTPVESGQVLTVALSDYDYGHAAAFAGSPLYNMEAVTDALPFLEYTLYPAVERAAAACISPVADGRITKIVTN